MYYSSVSYLLTFDTWPKNIQKYLRLFVSNRFNRNHLILNKLILNRLLQRNIHATNQAFIFISSQRFSKYSITFKEYILIRRISKSHVLCLSMYLKHICQNISTRNCWLTFIIIN